MYLVIQKMSDLNLGKVTNSPLRWCGGLKSVGVTVRLDQVNKFRDFFMILGNSSMYWAWAKLDNFYKLQTSKN
jgi:hypothetical protein